MRNPNPSDKISNHHLNLNITITSPPPSLFHCPISLEVMRSPVSLCTGVTYDRSSIKRWLDNGNTTCPATMQPLPSTELIPNLTLRRLIHQWSSELLDFHVPNSSHKTGYIREDCTLLIRSPRLFLLGNVGLFLNTLPHVQANIFLVLVTGFSVYKMQHRPSLSHLANILSNPFVDLEYKRSLLSSSALRPSALTSLFLSRETLPLAVTLVSLLLSLDFFDEERKRELTAAILSDLDAATSGIVAVLKAHSSSKVAAARVLEMLIVEARTAISEKPELMKEMLKLLEENDAELVDAALRCLLGVIKAGGRERIMIVRMGVVPVLTNLMEKEADGIPATVVAKAMIAMELAAGCGEGLAAVCAEAERCVVAVVGVMMKIGSEGREAAVAVLWRVCCAGGGDRRGRDAASAANEGLAKILVVMQGDCSPAARKMAGDLLRVFWGNDRSLMGMGFDSKTMHVMPF